MPGLRPAFLASLVCEARSRSGAELRFNSPQALVHGALELEEVRGQVVDRLLERSEADIHERRRDIAGDRDLVQARLGPS
jgi:hypothetical protein